MKILDRYILKLFFSMFILMLFIVSTMIVVVKFIDEIDFFIRNHASAYTVIQYFIYYLPTSYHRLVPMSVVIATLITLLVMNLHNELIAIQAGGISRMRVVTNIVFASVIIALLLWCNNEYLLPAAIQKSKTLVAKKIEKKASYQFVAESQTWMKGPVNDFYSIGLVGPQAKSLHNLQIFQMNPEQNRMLSQTFVQSAAWDEPRQIWIGEWVRERTFDSQQVMVREQFTKTKALPLAFNPKEFIQVVQLPNQMNTRQLKAHIGLLKHSGIDVRESQTVYYQRIANVLSPIILALIGLGYGFYMRKMEIASGFAQAIIISLVYLMIAQYTMNLGRSGVLNPALGAWIANLAIGGWAVYRLHKVLKI